MRWPQWTEPFQETGVLWRIALILVCLIVSWILSTCAQAAMMPLDSAPW